jgi:AcrR family transcriptional regulator
MGTAERRERQRQTLREQILNAARELFTELGYEAVTMRKIAEKIEYSPTTIYLHFSDKRALVNELCSMDFLELGKRFHALEAEPNPIRRLKGIGTAFLLFARGWPNHYRMMFMTPHPPVAVEDRRIEKGNPEVDAWAFLKGTIAEAQQRGMLRTDLGGPEVLAQIFFAGTHGVAALHIAKANDPWIDWRPVDEIADCMFELLLRGCGPSSARSALRRAGRRPGDVKKSSVKTIRFKPSRSHERRAGKGRRQ